MKDNKLEVGDEIYSMGGFLRDTYHIHGKIDRVTKTMAFIGDRKFKRETVKFCGDINTSPIPRETGYNKNTYSLVTEEVRERIKAHEIRMEKENILYKWGGPNFASAVRELSDDKLSRIADILQEDV